MSEVSRIGLDTSKHVFEVHGVDAAERVVLQRRLTRSQVEKFFAGLPAAVIGIEACGAAHHWARLLGSLGHQVRLLPAQYVRPFVRRGKNDRADAEAICEAVGRPRMPVVPVKSVDQQAAGMLLTVRELLVKQRTMLINAIRGHVAEFGVIGARGTGRVAEVLARARDVLPELAMELVEVLAGQLGAVEARLQDVERKLLACHRSNELSLRLAGIPGVGPIGAMALALKVPDPKLFRSARHFAAWIGLTPKEHSTAGRQRLGRISRQGDETLRRLLVVGATAVVAQAGRGRGSPWLRDLLKRRPPKLAAVALANKTARIAWAMMVSGQAYRCASVAQAA